MANWGLRRRPSRLHRGPQRTSTGVEQQILALRERGRRDPDWIGAELGVPARPAAQGSRVTSADSGLCMRMAR